MPKSNSVVYTTIYPGVEKFLAPWFQSVCRQNDSEFDLFIALDGVEDYYVRAFAGCSIEAEWFRGDGRGTPASIRNEAWNILAGKYETVIFVDCDDVLEPCRVSRAKKFLGRYDMTACRVRLIDEDGNGLPGGILNDGMKFDGSDLLRTNVFGLTNSSCRCSLLRDILPIPESCRLVDWYLATKAWLGGAEMAADPVCGMAYRQHGNNTARVVYPFSPEDILEATGIVLQHYDLILAHILPKHPEHQPRFLQRRAEVAEFYEVMTYKPWSLDRYTEALNRRKIEYAWWACVAHPSLENLWKS